MKDIMRDEFGAPKIVDRSTFQAELDALRIREKAHTREGDAIAAARRRLPMVEVDGATPLIGEHGAVTLSDVFEGRRILIAYYFMWHAGHPAPEQCEGAPSIRLRSASCPLFILATPPTSCCAKALMKRALGTATSWAGRCLGTRPRHHSTPVLTTLLPFSPAAACERFARVRRLRPNAQSPIAGAPLVRFFGTEERHFSVLRVFGTNR
jgi:hypothetical protein